MHDNKLRLSADVIEKAQIIADEWGLKNSRAAIEAVFRKYADDYLYGRQTQNQAAYNYPERSVVSIHNLRSNLRHDEIHHNLLSEMRSPTHSAQANHAVIICEAVSELDGILGL
jgi:hypothetical protein